MLVYSNDFVRIYTMLMQIKNDYSNYCGNEPNPFTEKFSPDFVKTCRYVKPSINHTQIDNRTDLVLCQYFQAMFTINVHRKLKTTQTPTQSVGCSTARWYMLIINVLRIGWLYEPSWAWLYVQPYVGHGSAFRAGRSQDQQLRTHVRYRDRLHRIGPTVSVPVSYWPSFSHCEWLLSTSCSEGMECDASMYIDSEYTSFRALNVLSNKSFYDDLYLSIVL